MNELPTVNRLAVVLIRRGAYRDWANSCFDDGFRMTMEDIGQEPTVYLIPEGESEPIDNLKEHYQTIFSKELELWCVDRSRWPKERTFEVFKDFFTIQMASIVFDVEQGEIVKGIP